MSPARTALILGASSDIARAVSRALAEAGVKRLMLAARRTEALAADAADLSIRFGAEVSLHAFDALCPESFSAFIEALPALPEVTICAVGTLGEQQRAERDPWEAIRIVRTNFEGPALILGLIAERLVAAGVSRGTIVGISSVAGERGRASNYVYGSAKAGFTAFLSGLRNRLQGTGLRVITVLPGFVDTRMTAGMSLPRALTASPEQVGRAILRALHGRRDVVYVKPIWRLIIAVIRALPEPIFKRTRL